MKQAPQGLTFTISLFFKRSITMLYDKTFNHNALVNENDNASLHNNACLEAIPYEKHCNKMVGGNYSQSRLLFYQ